VSFNPAHWSYSALKKYENCPRQYSEIVVRRNYKDEFTSPTGATGDRFHKSAESYIMYGGELDNEFKALEPVLNVIRGMNGTKYPEWKAGVAPDGAPLGWNDPRRWFQGVADLVVIGDSPVARLADYKTGQSKYADTDQLELMSLLIFAHFPQIKLVKGQLIFVLEGRMIPRVVDVKDKDRIWQKYREKDAKRVASFNSDNWPARSSGLCKKHCAVLSCEHNGRK
jgi:hypothetical protein